MALFGAGWAAAFILVFAWERRPWQCLMAVTLCALNLLMAGAA